MVDLHQKWKPRKSKIRQTPSYNTSFLCNLAESEFTMRRFIASVLAAVLLVTAGLSLMHTARGQESNSLSMPIIETEGENIRQIDAPALIDGEQMPLISVIDSPSPTCYQPDPSRDTCYLKWYYMSVNAAPATSMLTMTLTLNDFGPVAHTQGFFQSSMFVPYNMLSDGFRVTCGSLGAGGNPKLGNAYGYTIRARDSNGQVAANFGTIFCPAFTP